MSEATGSVWAIDASPRFKARITGVFYLLTILLGMFSQGFVNQRLVVGDAAATASNILAHKGLFQLGFVGYLIEMGCQTASTMLFYELLKPVSKSVSLLAASVSFLGIVIKTFGRLFFIAPLFVLGGHHPFTEFTVEQLQGLALLFLKLSDKAAEIGLVFFGFGTFLKGCLILRSTFFPRILGAISILGGLGWLAFLYPPLAYRLFPLILAIGLLGSAAFILWLLVVGVNAPRWKEQARAAAVSLS